MDCTALGAGAMESVMVVQWVDLGNEESAEDVLSVAASQIVLLVDIAAALEPDVPF